MLAAHEVRQEAERCQTTRTSARSRSCAHPSTSCRPFDALAPDRQTAAARESTTLILEMAAFIRECAEHPKLNKTEKAIAQALLDRLILAGFTNGGPDTPPTEA